MMEYKQGLNCFYVIIGTEEEKIAEMTFTRIGNDKATIDHTFVDPAYRGKGIADKLLEQVISALEHENRTIIPLCSFAVKKMKN